MRLTLVLIIIMALFNFFGCAKKFVNKTPIGQKFPSVQGQSLDKKKYNIPEDFFGEKVLFLIGFVQNILSKGTKYAYVFPRPVPASIIEISPLSKRGAFSDIAIFFSNSAVAGRNSFLLWKISTKTKFFYKHNY